MDQFLDPENNLQVDLNIDNNLNNEGNLETEDNIKTCKMDTTSNDKKKWYGILCYKPTIPNQNLSNQFISWNPKTSQAEHFRPKSTFLFSTFFEFTLVESVLQFSIWMNFSFEWVSSLFDIQWFHTQCLIQY